MIIPVTLNNLELNQQSITVQKLDRSVDAHLLKNFYTESEPHSFIGTSSWGQYAEAYFGPSLGDVKHIAYGFFHENKLIAIWNVLSYEHQPDLLISSPSDPVRPPIFATGTPSKYQKLIIKNILSYANANENLWYSSEPLDTELDLSDWQTQSLLLGAEPHSTYELLVDLKLSTDEIWSRIRKRFKTLINKARISWKVEVITRPSESDWKEFSNFHELVSGRLTRSLLTWEIQRQWVWNDIAFAIFLRDNQNELVGAGLFTHNQHQANYFTGVYDRTLFDQPVGHLVQWEAILELQRRRVATYRIGERSYSGLLSTPTQKDLAISFFKEGFATQTAPVSLLIHKTNSLSERSIDEAHE